MSEECNNKIEMGDEHYAEHLADVNEDNEVNSTDDIRNANGVLLVKKGARIDNKAVKKIIQHKLSKPLEDQVAIKDSITNEKLLSNTLEILKKFPDIKTVMTDNKFDNDIKEIILGTEIPALIFQNLTVLSHQQADVFEKAVYTALLAALIANKLGLDLKQKQTAYLAALVHDIGLLRISPDILNKKGQLTSDEWRAIQSHVVIGELMFRSTPGLPESISRATLEHHERCDGTGYPSGKNEGHLEIFGQIVGLADSMQAIRANQFDKKGLNLANAIPYLQMNSTTFFHPVYRAAHMLIKSSSLIPATHMPNNDHSSLALEILGKTEGLKGIVVPLSVVHEIITPLKPKKNGAATIRIASRLIERINSSGIFSQELCQWIKSLHDNNSPDKKDLSELTYTDLMLSELSWQLESVRKNLSEYIDHECDQSSDAYPELQTNLTLFSNCLQIL